MSFNIGWQTILPLSLWPIVSWFNPLTKPGPGKVSADVSHCQKTCQLLLIKSLIVRQNTMHCRKVCIFLKCLLIVYGPKYYFKHFSGLWSLVLVNLSIIVSEYQFMTRTRIILLRTRIVPPPGSCGYEDLSEHLCKLFLCLFWGW